MEREIKFRGKRIDTGEWITGGYVEWSDSRDNRNYQIVSGNGHHNNVDPETVGQFTGLKDKNGKEIYEGDIIGGDFFSYGEKTCFREIVKVYEYNTDFNNFYMERIKGYRPDFMGFEVIGNIHDNPELINATPESVF